MGVTARSSPEATSSFDGGVTASYFYGELPTVTNRRMSRESGTNDEPA
jgi:hypothetical protein